MTLLRNLPLVLVTVLDSAASTFLSRDDYLRNSDFYVDAVNGDDANDGTSAASPFQTISKLPTITANMKLGFACGSRWEETLDLENGCKAGAYVPPQTGNTTSPIFDCANRLDSFTKTGGFTNIYQVTLPKGATSETYINAFEDDSFLTPVTSLANCDSTAGSFIVSTNAGANPTLYVHASDSGNPNSNGSTYHGGVRTYAINGFGKDNLTIFDLVGLRNTGNNGSIVVGSDCVVHSCEMNQGGKHNALAREGTEFNNCTFSDYQNASSAATLVVINQDSPTGKAVAFKDCTFDGVSIKSTSVQGIFMHQNVSGIFGDVLIDGCEFYNLNSGIACGDCGDVVIDHAAFNNVQTGITVPALIDHLILSSDFISPNTGGSQFITTSDDDARFTLDTCTSTMNTSGVGNSIFIQHAGAIGLVQNSNFEHNGVHSTSGVLFVQNRTGVDITWNTNGSVIDAGYLVRDLSADLEYAGNNNGWCSSATFFIMQFHGTGHGSLQLWQSATGQDAASNDDCP